MSVDRVVAFYTPREVATLLKVSERTVRRWIAHGTLTARRFGRQLRVPTEALDAFAHTAADGGDWAALAADSFARDWENERDAAYDRWREHYGVPEG